MFQAISFNQHNYQPWKNRR
jgi:hypothetical protein